MIGRMLASGMMAAALVAAPATAGVKEGIAAWQRGDFPAAVAQWKPGADAGDADAEFNLAQAYKLGRGVPQDLGQAQAWYYKAARQGHPQAEANYGLILFQNGDRAGAMPWLQKAAQLGEPRAQYVVGTALFNGDLADKDWPRAYAYMTRAAGAGLPQAASSLAQMDSFMPVADRQRGVALARSLAQPTPIVPGPGGATPLPTASGSAFGMTGTPGIATATLPPSSATGEQIAAATPPAKATKKGKARKAEDDKVAFAAPTPTVNFDPPENAAQAPQMEAPAPAPAPAPPPAPGAARQPAPPAAPTPPPVPAPKRPRPVEAAVKASPGGKWRVQLGAFGSAAGASAAWKTVAPALGGIDHYAVAAGPVTRLQAGPFASRDDAARACASAKGRGASCFVVAAP